MLQKNCDSENHSSDLRAKRSAGALNLKEQDFGLFESNIIPRRPVLIRLLSLEALYGLRAR